MSTPDCNRPSALRGLMIQTVRPMIELPDDRSTGILKMARYAFWSLVALLGTGTALAGDAPPQFGRAVLPILKARCLKCHGRAQRKGGLSLRPPAAMLEGGDSGPALVRG